MSTNQRIEVDPAIMQGEPVIRGTRIPQLSFCCGSRAKVPHQRARKTREESWTL
jgi:hypothetical protein